jgi:crotonobetainyl-CoA:carnitine CoA-transferase CaiB-like acyl-CoA transferase
MKAINPGVIMLSTALGGQDGPQAHLAGFGTMGAALSGFHELTGWPDRPPSGPFLAYTDYIAPRFMAASILAALDHRRRTGEGQYIDISQQEAAILMLAPAMLDYTVNGRVQTRNGNASPVYAPHGVYPAAGDDRWVAIACETEPQWQALCAVAGRPEWGDDARFATLAARLANGEALDEAIAAWSAAFAPEALVERLQAAGVPSYGVSNSADAHADPQLAARGHFIRVPHPELGEVTVEASRFHLSRTPSAVGWSGPVLGQHNDVVLRELLGLSDDEIVELIAAECLE